jgi:hypothetical protein
MPLTITEEMMEQDPFFQMGFQEGVRIGRKKVIQKLYLRGDFSPKGIADLLEVPLEFVEEAIAELQKGKEEK